MQATRGQPVTVTVYTWINKKVTTMADKGTKNINQWQPRERVNLNGNEGINIALDGNEGIFSTNISHSNLVSSFITET